MQIPYYLGDLTEKLETEDRMQLIRVSKGQLLVRFLSDNSILHYKVKLLFDVFSKQICSAF